MARVNGTMAMIISRCNIGWRAPVLLVLILIGLSGFQKANAAPSADDNDDGLRQYINQAQFDEGERIKFAMLQQLVPVLLQSGKAGRIYYEADCPSDEPYGHNHFIFPTIDVHTPSKDVSGLAAVREIFQGYSNVEVTENPMGIIRVKIGKISDEILNTNISHLAFVPNGGYKHFQQLWERIAQRDKSWEKPLMGPPGEYDPESAIDEIERSEDVQAAQRKLHIREGNGMIHHGVNPPDKGAPYLSAPLDHVTLDGALNVVAQTFKGIVMYGSCAKQRPYYAVYFTGGPNFDLSGLTLYPGFAHRM